MSPTGGRPAVFLDRDGTVVEERDYLADPDDVALVPGAARAIVRLREAGYAVVVVTNQSGIARGLYSEADYRAVAARVSELLAAEGATLTGTYYCPHHPDLTGPCDCRKPGTGMYRRAAADLGLDLSRSVYVGDKVTDVEPGLALGGRSLLVRTGYGRMSEPQVPAGVEVVDDLPGAVALILDEPLR